MADAVNATQALAQANSQAQIDAPITDESLNAGALLPDEPIADVLSQEVGTAPNVILEMVAKLDDTPLDTIIQESIFHSLVYLRQDLHQQRGMTQQIAAEALQLLPDFNEGLPVNYYSRHPSQTGYRIAVEAIDTGLQNEVLNYLAGMNQRLDRLAYPPASDTIYQTLDYTRRASQIALQADLFEEYRKGLLNVGWTWDDSVYRGSAVDPSQGAVPSILTIEKSLPASWVAMNAYYQAHLALPTQLEDLSSTLQSWIDGWDGYLDGGDLPSLTLDKTLAQLGDSLAAALETNADPDPSTINSFAWSKGIANAAEQSKTSEILAGLKMFQSVAAEARARVQQVRERIEAGQVEVDQLPALQKALSAFDAQLQAMALATSGAMRWCLNAGVVTSYIGFLVARVSQISWQAVQSCVATMQMEATQYDYLKQLVVDLQGPVVTNVV